MLKTTKINIQSIDFLISLMLLNVKQVCTICYSSTGHASTCYKAQSDLFFTFDQFQAPV